MTDRVEMTVNYIGCCQSITLAPVVFQWLTYPNVREVSFAAVQTVYIGSLSDNGDNGHKSRDDRILENGNPSFLWTVSVATSTCPGCLVPLGGMVYIP